MRALALALCILLAGCFGRATTQTEVVGNIIVVGPSERAVQECVTQVTREDVPDTSNGRRPTVAEQNRYIRKLEDALEFCQTVVRETDAQADAARARAQELNRQQ